MTSKITVLIGFALGKLQENIINVMSNTPKRNNDRKTIFPDKHCRFGNSIFDKCTILLPYRNLPLGERSFIPMQCHHAVTDVDGLEKSIMSYLKYCLISS